MNTKLKGCLLSLILLVAVTAVHAQTRLAEANTSADMDSAIILDSVPIKRNFFRKFLNYFNDANKEKKNKKFDFAKNIVIDNRNSIAFHVGAGIAVPYGNATIVPFEKRYFSGGANSVRGWSVRDLGPGVFPGDGNFMNQSGDVKLDAST
jgi:hypothetical protein